MFYTAILVIRSLGFIIDHSFFLILLIKLFSGMGTHFWSRNYTRTTVLNEIINCQEKVKNVYSLNTCSIVNSIVPFFKMTLLKEIYAPRSNFITKIGFWRRKLRLSRRLSPTWPVLNFLLPYIILAWQPRLFKITPWKREIIKYIVSGSIYEPTTL